MPFQSTILAMRIIHDMMLDEVGVPTDADMNKSKVQCGNQPVNGFNPYPSMISLIPQFFKASKVLLS